MNLTFLLLSSMFLTNLDFLIDPKLLRSFFLSSPSTSRLKSKHFVDLSQVAY